MKTIHVLSLVAVIVLAGCLGGAGDLNETANTSDDSTTSNISNTTNTTPEDVVVTASSIDAVKEYLDANPIDVFGEQSSRIISVDLDIPKAFMTYRVSTSDPESESTYFSGVLFKVFPDVTKVDIKGYNSNYDIINNSYKSPTREQYRFENYKVWFPDYVPEVECTEAADCADANSCTKDGCYNGKCSNVEIIGCV